MTAVFSENGINTVMQCSPQGYSTKHQSNGGNCKRLFLSVFTVFFFFFFCKHKTNLSSKVKAVGWWMFLAFAGKETRVKPGWIYDGDSLLTTSDSHKLTDLSANSWRGICLFPSYWRTHTPPCQVYSFTLVSPRAVFHFKWVFPRKEKKGEANWGRKRISAYSEPIGHI